MSEDHDDLDEAFQEECTAVSRELTEFAIEHGLNLDVQVTQCDHCGTDHIEEAWVWAKNDAGSLGVVYASFDLFTVHYDTNTEDEDAPCYEWDCEAIEEADLLISMLRARFEL